MLLTVNALPPYEELHDWLYEDPPGILRWKKKKMRGKRSFQAIAGSATYRKGKAYWTIRFQWDKYPRSRIIFKMHHNRDPLGVVDHINHDTLDDRIENLRDFTMGENNRNREKRPAGGFFTWTALGKEGYGKRYMIRFAISCHTEDECVKIAAHLEATNGAYIQGLYDKWRVSGDKCKLLKFNPSKKLGIQELNTILGDI